VKARNDARRSRHRGEAISIAEQELEVEDNNGTAAVDDESDASATATTPEHSVSAAALLEYLPDGDSTLRVRPFGRCAVVGNSGALLSAGLGAEIDAHELVIRFNYPPLAGYERDVGNRTDWMLTGGSTELRSNHHPFKQYSDYHARDALTLMLFPPSLDRMPVVASYFRRADMPRLRFLSSYFVALSNRVLTAYLRAAPGNFQRNAKGHAYRATSGLRGVLAALLACNHTDVYGFGASRETGHGHYYAPAGSGVQLENVGHSYSLERQLMRDLANGAVTCAQLRPVSMRLLC
jgi:hypothetical protein